MEKLEKRLSRLEKAFVKVCLLLHKARVVKPKIDIIESIDGYKCQKRKIEQDIELYETLKVMADPNESFEGYFGYDAEEELKKLDFVK